MLEYFLDPVLRAPTIGSMLMCLSASLIGSITFLQKRSLSAEALSHASYPGVILSVMLMSAFFPFSEGSAALAIMGGAFVTALLGLFTVHFLERKLRIKSDAALCLVLSIFFGVGILFMSHLQFTAPLWLLQIQVYLFGQAATMVDYHIALYGALSLLVAAAIALLFYRLQILNFDPSFAKTVGMPTRRIHFIVHVLLVLSIVIGMRSVGVVLISGMLIAPPVAARQWTGSLASFLGLSALLGMASAFLGVYLSTKVPAWIGQPQLCLPTGPMIVLSASVCAFFSLIFSPRRAR